MTDIVERLNDSLSAGYSELRKEAAAEIVRLRAKIAEMERQEPVGWIYTVNGGWDCYSPMKPTEDVYDTGSLMPLYALPGAKAQNATSVPSEEDESVRKAWSRFSNELHRGPDAPYPGMSEAFEQHFSQSFTDRDWRAESGTWAAAWKAAKRHGAQSARSQPEGWLRAIDEALVVAHIGVANAGDTYEQAKAKLDNLIGLHVDIATDPAVNGGWKLVPVEILGRFPEINQNNYNHDDVCNLNAWGVELVLAAAPEAKPCP